MIRMLQGLPFEIVSPSFIRLRHDRADSRDLDVSYVDGQQWLLTLHDRDTDETVTKLFPSRDAAVAMIAQAFQNVEAL